jgi:DNA-binding PadR family transcriptional regulator
MTSGASICFIRISGDPYKLGTDVAVMTDKNHQARFYSLTAEGRRQLAREEKSWRRLTEDVSRVLSFA